VEYKNLPNELSFKKDDAKFKIYGYASIFGNCDAYGDIIAKGAFEESITFKKDIKFLWQHDASSPIGNIDRLYEDSKGLCIEASINCQLMQGREAALLIKDKAIDSLSIGFTINKSHISKNGERIITDLKLWEISLVTFPANQMAKITDNYKSHLHNQLNKIEKSLINLERSIYGRNFK